MKKHIAIIMLLTMPLLAYIGLTDLALAKIVNTCYVIIIGVIIMIDFSVRDDDE